MQDYVIVRVSWTAVFRVFFAAGTCVGGIGGIFLGLMMDSSVGFFGGAFLGLAAGLISGLTATAYAVVFNALAPYFGGMPVSVTAKTTNVESAAPSRETESASPDG